MFCVCVCVCVFFLLWLMPKGRGEYGWIGYGFDMDGGFGVLVLLGSAFFILFLIWVFVSVGFWWAVVGMVEAQWWWLGSGGAMLEVEGACDLVRPTDTSGDKLLMRNCEWVRTREKHKERKKNGMVRQNKWRWKIKEQENTKKQKTKKKMEDKGMEEFRRRWKVKVWRDLEGTYACEGKNWKKTKKKFII